VDSQGFSVSNFLHRRRALTSLLLRLRRCISSSLHGLYIKVRNTLTWIILTYALRGEGESSNLLSAHSSWWISISNRRHRYILSSLEYLTIFCRWKNTDMVDESNLWSASWGVWRWAEAIMYPEHTYWFDSHSIMTRMLTRRCCSVCSILSEWTIPCLWKWWQDCNDLATRFVVPWYDLS
jgi:hypothetical protein